MRLNLVFYFLLLSFCNLDEFLKSKKIINDEECLNHNTNEEECLKYKKGTNDEECLKDKKGIKHKGQKGTKCLDKKSKRYQYKENK